MLTLSATLRRAIASPEVQTFRLYEIYFLDPNGLGELTSPMYLTDCSVDVVWGGHTYESWAIKCGDISQNSDGQIDDVSLAIGNLDEERFIQKILENYEVIGQKVIIRQFFKDSSNALIDEPISSTLRVKGATASLGSVTLTLSIGFDVLLQTVPSRVIIAKFCRWKEFKGPHCQYAGAETTCDRTWGECLRYSNTVHFGGFPAVLNSRLYF